MKGAGYVFLRRNVLPFSALPAGAAHLRRIVAIELQAYGFSDLLESAQLVVTELTANVIKHVGVGAPATLEMEFTAQRLRLAMHDTSPRLPVERQVSAESESGRGLALIAAISDGWGITPTAAGKSVWCELTSTSDGRAAALTRERMGRAEAVVRAYERVMAGPSTLFNRSPAMVEEAASGLIADLLYWLAARGCEADDVLDRAQTHFEAETTGKRDG